MGRRIECNNFQRFQWNCVLLVSVFSLCLCCFVLSSLFLSFFVLVLVCHLVFLACLLAFSRISFFYIASSFMLARTRIHHVFNFLVHILSLKTTESQPQQEFCFFVVWVQTHSMIILSNSPCRSCRGATTTFGRGAPSPATVLPRCSIKGSTERASRPKGEALGEHHGRREEAQLPSGGNTMAKGGSTGGAPQTSDGGEHKKKKLDRHRKDVGHAAIKKKKKTRESLSE